MGCGISSAISGLDWYLLEQEQACSPAKQNCTSAKAGLDQNSEVCGLYNVTSGAVSHTLLVLEDGRIIVDGKFAQSVVYKQGRKEFKFSMFDETIDLMSGEVCFSDSSSINGVFFTKNNSSYVIQGTLDKSSDVQKAEGTGKDSVVIDEHTLKRYRDIEGKLDGYQKKELMPGILQMTEKGEVLEKSISEKVEEIEEMKKKLDIIKKQYGEDSEEAKNLEIELESKCLALSADQEQYDEVLKYIRTSTADLFDYNILTEEFDELLNAMFGGNNGSELENQLEDMVEEMEEARKRHDNSYDKEEIIWHDAKNLCTLVLQGLNTWSSLQRDDYDDKKRLFLAKQTRSILVLLCENLIALEASLEEDGTFKPETECREKIIFFKSDIFEMYTKEDRIEEGIDILMFCKDATRRIEQWVYEKFKLKDCHETSKSLKKDMMEAKLKLKRERRGLIHDWLLEHVGEVEKEDTLLSDGTTDLSKDSTLIEEQQEIKGEFDINEAYEQIVSGIQAREGKPELDGIRAELELQSKMRARRKRQRHLRAQKLLEVQQTH